MDQEEEETRKSAPTTAAQPIILKSGADEAVWAVLDIEGLDAGIKRAHG
jgi:hypothetical protein